MKKLRTKFVFTEILKTKMLKMPNIGGQIYLLSKFQGLECCRDKTLGGDQRCISPPETNAIIPHNLYTTGVKSIDLHKNSKSQGTHI